ncbi:MAG: YoaP domain-containing protein [Eubacteriales bacterium]|nr:YoaP domain-containing protein [Eubacteriales bacterium]
MEYIKVTKENIENEHICCAISNNKDIQVSSKKDWMKQCFEDGLVFLKSTERGKCFIEYIPAENAWVPIIAKNYMYIDCFWVSGSFKGHGYSNDLLKACIKDAKVKGKIGLCILSSLKKKPFLSDPKYLLHKGFKIADESDTEINLMYLPFDKKAIIPKFKDIAKHPHIKDSGYVLYYTSQCPFNGKYVPILEKIAKENNIPFKAIHIETKKQAQLVPSPCTTYAMFYNGKFLTNEQFNDKKFLKMVQAQK